MGRLPTAADFPAKLVLTINPPPATSPRTTNVLLLLHGLGDTQTLFATLGAQLRLPETTTIAVRAPQPVPFVPGFHWGDDLVFGTGGGDGGMLDPDAGFKTAMEVLGEGVVRVLVRECGYSPREVFLMGFGQGGMVGLSVALGLEGRGAEWWLQGRREEKGGEGKRKGEGKGEEKGEGAGQEERIVSVERVTEGGGEGEGETTTSTPSNPSSSSSSSRPTTSELGGIISIGGPLPLSSSSTSSAHKLRTPILLCRGSEGSALTDSSLERTRLTFESVQCVTWKGRGDWMPRNREQMVPVMSFLARRLRSRAGVPEGSVEVG